ncbi:Pre-mRNA-splicing factor SPF27 [Halteromyces radiatus]|uniref:Pre-mRNA-splicing factor SPF27 n=1 Tax=Halteromyces radiatus TaxID=101107 RepID=UPI00221EFCB7|nr:Pre-mRNA-splicing factor SPF27 [Halteromyces radiatus]KAI8098467.1 Pre-mRNA-splicing factor SPF27 [Halteromyces radiatus]
MSDTLIESSSTKALGRSDIDIDALPYVDREIDDADMKASVDRLIEQEMRRMKRKERSELPLSVDLFQNNDILSQEWHRVGKKENLVALDETRYELQGPDSDDVEAWKKAVDNTKAQLESQAGSMFNLELLQKYGANAWRVHNYQLEADLKQIQQETEDYRNQINQINRERKADQMKAAETLQALENKWSDLISQNLQVEIGCAALESEVEELRQYRQKMGTQ